MKSSARVVLPEPARPLTTVEVQDRRLCSSSLRSRGRGTAAVGEGMLILSTISSNWPGLVSDEDSLLSMDLVRLPGLKTFFWLLTVGLLVRQTRSWLVLNSVTRWFYLSGAWCWDRIRCPRLPFESPCTR